MSRISNLHRRAFGLFALLILGSLAGPALADHDASGVTLFRHVYFEGQQQTFYGDVPDLGETFIGNDAVSSIALDRGCRTTLYADYYFRGRSVTLDHDVADLRRTYVGNDRVSSLRVDCPGGGYGRPAGYDDGRGYDGRGYDGRGYDERGYDGRGYGGRGATVFADAGFRGRSETFDCDDPDLRDNHIRQDTASSIVVDPGCRAILYEDVGFRGDATVISGDFDNLRYSAVGNDRVSSIRVECRRR